MITLAIDPGVKHLGVAMFEGDRLVCAALVKTEDRPALAEILFTYGYPDLTVIEVPQCYQRSKSKGDPNDLIAVALVVGALQERLQRVELVKPRVWKGAVKKEVMLKRIAGKLTPEEQAILPKLPKTLAHNVLDAVGIGLFSVGRLKKNVDRKRSKA